MYVALGALVLLILVLTGLGIMMSQLKSLDVFPPMQNSCPDFWDVSSNPNVCVFPTSNSGAKNLGEIAKQSATVNGISLNYIDGTDSYVKSWAPLLGLTAQNGTAWTSTTGAPSATASTNFMYLTLNGNDASWNTLYPSLTPRCAKRKWAINNGIVWDGVTNYNGCT
jgi:hypothetical protein